MPDVISGDAVDDGREMVALMNPLEGTAALSAESIIYSETDDSDDSDDNSNGRSGNGSSASSTVEREEISENDIESDEASFDSNVVKVFGKLSIKQMRKQEYMLQHGPRGKFPSTYGSSKFAIANPEFDYSVVGYSRLHRTNYRSLLLDRKVLNEEDKISSSYRYFFTVRNPNPKNDPDGGEGKVIKDLIASKAAFSSSAMDSTIPHLKSANHFGWVNIDPLSPLLQRRDQALRKQHKENYYKYMDDVAGKKRGRRRGMRLLGLSSATPPRSPSDDRRNTGRSSSSLGLGLGGSLGDGLGSPGLNSNIANFASLSSFKSKKSIQRALPHILRFAYKPSEPSSGISWRAQWIRESWRGLEWTTNYYRRILVLEAKAEEAESEEGRKQAAIESLMEANVSLDSVSSYSIPSSVHASYMSDTSSKVKAKFKHIKYPLAVKNRPGSLAGWTDALTPAFSLVDEV